MKKFFAYMITALVILVSNAAPFINCAAISEKKWVYYINSNDNNRLYKMLSDNTNVTKLSDYIVSQAVVCDDWIYFTVSYKDTAPRSDYGLFRIKTDGSSEEELITDYLRDGPIIMTDIDNIYRWSDYICIQHNDEIYIYYNNELCRTVTLNEYIYIDDTHVGTDHWSSRDWEEYLNNPEIGYYLGYYFSGYKNGYVYLKNCMDGSYSKIKIDDLADFKCNLTGTGAYAKLIKEKKLPEKFDSKKNLPHIPTDYYREKKLAWSKTENCIKYKISKYDKKKKDFSVISETEETSAIISVLDSEYDLEYKVTAVKKSKGKEIYTDVPLAEYHAKEYCIGNGRGVSAEYGDLYIVCLSDGIYSVDKNGKKISRISEDTAVLVYYADGTVYYITAQDSDYYSSLYMITADGKNKKKLYRGSECWDFTVTNKNIYLNLFDDDWWSSSILKIDRESEEIVQIVGGGVVDPIIDGMCFCDDRVFYFHGESGYYDMSPNNIISKDVNGPNTRIVTRKRKGGPIFTHEGYLYFFSDGLCRVNTDGSEFKRLIGGDTFDEAYGCQINGSRLYFLKKSGIYSIGTDGTDMKKIIDSEKYAVDSFTVYDDGIIFTCGKMMYFFDFGSSVVNEIGSIV